MKILIIGGTNFIGPFLVRHLLTMGHDITLFHRGKTKADLPDNLHQIYGDRSQLQDFKREFESLSPDVVVDMICYTESNARMLINLFKGITRRVVAISSMDVYRAYGIILGKESGVIEVPLTEDSDLRSSLYPFKDMKDMPKRALNTPADYEKILVERVVMSDCDLPGTIIRLPMVYGENDPLNRIFPYLQRMDDSRDAIVLLDSIAKWRGSYGYVENIGYAIALAVTNERAKGRIYHVAQSETLSEGERITKIGELAGWKGKVVSLSKEKFPDDWNLPFNTEQDWFVDSSRIRQELGYREIVPLDEALKRTIKWARNHPSSETQQLVAPWLLDYPTEDAVLTK
ncbi:MAG: NAD-dependent epimerase/dehydratase family protein [Rivularia sp. (in: cyanobacteria)]